MAASWLHYWKAPQVRRGLADGLLTHIASGQFSRVAPGDRIWIVSTGSGGELITIGYVDATQPISTVEARRRVDYEPWEAPYHILVAPEAAQRARLVNLSEIAAQLRFQSATSDHLRIEDGRVNGQQLQTMRRLTPESARLMQQAWNREVEDQDAEYERIEQELAELGELDARREILVRTEQGFLRRHLFGADGAGTCALCGNEYPTSLLIAAHVKRRADCTDAERRDYVNNVVPMCVFGCDALFERGLLVVEDGIIRKGSRVPLTEAAREYVSRLVGRSCEIWSPANARYFEWHANRAEPSSAS